MGGSRIQAMLATLGGALALVLGLAVLLLPLLAPELSRARDAVWGAVVLLLGLVLVTSADRLTGAPMLGVLCAGLLIGRLAVEVGQGRWFRLTPEEQRALWSRERWQMALAQLGAALAKLLAMARGAAALVGGWIGTARIPKTTSKRWVRPEEKQAAQAGPTPESEPSPASTPEPLPEQPAEEPAAAAAPDPPAPTADPVPEPVGEGQAAAPGWQAARGTTADPAPITVIPDLDAVDALLDAETVPSRGEVGEQPAAEANEGGAG